MYSNLSNLYYGNGKYINPFYNTANLKQKPLKFKTKFIEPSNLEEEKEEQEEQEEKEKTEKQIMNSKLSKSEILSRICDFD
jgi:hypothetical protein